MQEMGSMRAALKESKLQNHKLEQSNHAAVGLQSQVTQSLLPLLVCDVHACACVYIAIPVMPTSTRPSSKHCPHLPGHNQGFCQQGYIQSSVLRSPSHSRNRNTDMRNLASLCAVLKHPAYYRNDAHHHKTNPDRCSTVSQCCIEGFARANR